MHREYASSCLGAATSGPATGQLTCKACYLDEDRTNNEETHKNHRISSNRLNRLSYDLSLDQISILECSLLTKRHEVNVMFDSIRS